MLARQSRWEEVTPDWDDDRQRGLQRRVAAPAVGLLITACLGVASNCGSAIILPSLARKSPATARPQGMDEETYQAYLRGQAAAPLLDLCLVSIPTLAIYPLLFAGSLRMQQMKSYGVVGD